MTSHPDVPRRAADGFVDCACGDKHWGRNGAAGLLLWRHGDSGIEVLLQLRAGWSHLGGTWSTPGGAIDWNESPLDGGLREFSEETGIPANFVIIDGSHSLTHPDWFYTTFVGHFAHDAGSPPLVGNSESERLSWTAWKSVPDLELIPAFRHALHELSQFLPAS